MIKALVKRRDESEKVDLTGIKELERGGLLLLLILGLGLF
jgi:hypothetical protein